MIYGKLTENRFNELENSERARLRNASQLFKNARAIIERIRTT